MDRKIVKWLKIIAVICAIILIIELGYICFIFFFKKNSEVYFDGINSFCSSGNFYVTVGSNNNNDEFLEKAKITKYNKNKEKVYERLYNKGFNGAFFDVVEDNSSYIAVGNYEATKKEREAGVRRALIVKYDKDGNILFDKDFQVLGNSKFTSVVVLEDGYIVSGQSVYENTTLGFSEKGGAFLVKYSKDGDELWRKNYGGNKSAIYNDVIVLGNDIYAVGKDSLNVGIISKYDSLGNHIKTVEYRYTDTLGFSGITSNGDYLYVCGAKGKDENNSEALIVRYDLDLNLINEVTYEGKGRKRYNQVIIDSHNNLVVIGTLVTVMKGDTNDTSELNHDGIIGKYDESLEKIDVITYGDFRDDYFTDINIDGSNYLVSGYSSYEDGSYLSKFINYSDALKVLEVQ